MFGLLKATVREFREDDVPQLAAALSYYTVFSLAPMLVLVVMAAGLLLDPQEVSRAIVEQASGAVGPGAAGQIETMLESAGPPGGDGVAVTVIGLAGFLFGATLAFAQLQKALNRVWSVEEAAGGFLSTLLARVVSFGFVLLVAGLLLASLVLATVVSVAGDAIAARLPATIGRGVLGALGIGFSLAIVTLLFTALYRILPDADIAWRDVWRGALATAVLFIAGQYVVGFYISRSEPGSAFGAAGSLALILVWIYYSAIIFLLGAEFTHAYAERRGRGIRPAG